MLELSTDWDRPCLFCNSGVGGERTLRARLRPRLGGDGVAARVALALDTSSSMDGPKLNEARQACLAATRLLRPQDRLSVIGFSTSVTEIVRDQAVSDVNQQDLSRRLDGLRAEGVTRTDLALDWIERTLRSQSGARFAVLATDGHPTNPRGEVLDDLTGLHGLAQRLGQAGVSLTSMALGDARNFNTTLLTDLVDLGRGKYLWAASEGELTGQLRVYFEQARAVGAEALTLTLTSAISRLELQACCQIAPHYLPMDRPEPAAGGPWSVKIHNVRGDVDTDLLFLFRLPAPGFGARAGTKKILGLAAQIPGSQVSAQAEASIRNVVSLTEEQTMNREVHEARLMWDLNVYQQAILHSDSLVKTGEWLAQVQKTAQEAGQPAIAASAQQQLDQLQRDGKLDQNLLSRGSQIVRGGGA